MHNVEVSWLARLYIRYHRLLPCVLCFRACMNGIGNDLARVSMHWGVLTLWPKTPLFKYGQVITGGNVPDEWLAVELWGESEVLSGHVQFANW